MKTLPVKQACARTKPERIIFTDFLIAAVNNRPVLAPRVVDLACGHKAITKNQKRMICPRCTEMLKRSIADGSEDYESFRKGDSRDEMHWAEDPCSAANEPHGWK